LIAAATLLLPGPALAAVSEGCRVPDAYLAMPSALDRTRHLVRTKKPVRVMVIGPVLGPSRGARSLLESALESRLPGINFEIIQALSPGLASDDFMRLRSLIAERSPDLVIWQVGVRDAMAASDVEEFEDVLGAASDWVDAEGLDLVLIDPPFIPHVAHERIYIPYIGEISEVSRTERVPLLRRYAAMQYLDAEADRASLADGAQPRCMPELVAEAIVRAVGK
jgi:hypothetical protein